jgi:hypothetical protein
MATLTLGAAGKAAAQAALSSGFFAKQAAAEASAKAFQPRQSDNYKARSEGRAVKVLTLLCGLAPAAFKNPPPPLKVGIRKDLAALLEGKLLDGKRITSRELYVAMSKWVNRSTYQRAVSAPGAMRHDLGGIPTEPVSETDRASAAASLATYTLRR